MRRGRRRCGGRRSAGPARPRHADSQRAAVVGFLQLQIKRVARRARLAGTRPAATSRLPAGRCGGGDELGEDLPAEDLLGGSGRRTGRTVRPSAASPRSRHGAKLFEVHRLFSASAVASSSNFLTLPDGVIGSASTKCHATGVFWRARPAACRCAASSPVGGLAVAVEHDERDRDLAEASRRARRRRRPGAPPDARRAGLRCRARRTSRRHG